MLGRCLSRFFILGSFAIAAAPCSAAPRMIAYGYANCVSCHISPQGRGLLNIYGEGIDDSQSFHQVGIAAPPWSLRHYTLRGQVIHDLRVVSNAGDFPTQDLRGQFEYRNATTITNQHQVLFTLAAKEPQQKKRQVSAYYTAPSRGQFSLNRLLWHYQVSKGFALQVGRDHLPTPINLSNRSLFVRTYNRWSATDWQTQAKLFYWDEKRQFQLFAWGPDFDQKHKHQEFGGGLLGETDVHQGNAVIGAIALAATSDALDRQLLGTYARLGTITPIGSMGLLLEYDVTHRRLDAESKPSFWQFATLAQVFWTPREWMVWQLTGQHLRVQAPFLEDTAQVGGGVSIRWTRHITTSFQIDQRLNPDGLTFGFSVALKM